MTEHYRSTNNLNRPGRVKAPLLWTALMAIVLLFYVALEAAYRTYLYFTFRAAMTEKVLVQTTLNPTELWVLDLDVGWRYAPNLDVSDDSPYPRRWRTNSHGHVSDREYPVEKSADEFRIAVLGDSFAANIDNAVRWVDLLNERLNANPNWSAIVKKPRTVVINFARDGIGLEQMAMIADHELAKYAPDLVIVNIIAGDIARQPHFRGYGALSPSPEETRHAVKRHVRRVLAEGHWLSPYPFLLGNYVLRHLDMPVRNVLATDGSLNRKMSSFDASEVVDRGVSALRTISKRFPFSLILVHPQHYDFIERSRIEAGDRSTGYYSIYIDLARALKANGPPPIVEMMYRLRKDLPGRDESFLNCCFLVDGHNNDEGVRRYAEAVEGVLLDVVPLIASGQHPNIADRCLAPNRPGGDGARCAQ